MERAHVLIRLRDGGDNHAAHIQVDGVCRTSATTVRLEHSDMLPGVASISFEQVFDQQHASADIFQQTASLLNAVDAVVDGHAMTLVATGASQSGKSFSMHGCDKKKMEQGLIELAIERVFSLLVGDDWQVLLSASFTDDECCLLVDAFTGESMDEQDPTVVSHGDAAFVSRAIRVGTSADALEAYRKALHTSQDHVTASTDFVCILFVETRQSPSNKSSVSSGGGGSIVRRGRLVCIDIHGHGIIEPRQQDPVNTQLLSTLPPKKPSLFVDTQFSIHEILTRWCGCFLGNDSSTFLLVTIQKAATKQQQAIQSLLYACKAKEIQSTTRIHQLGEFTVCSSSTPSTVVEEEPQSEQSPFPSPMRSTRSTQQTASDVLTERLRQAYQTVKNTSSMPAVQALPSLVATNVQALHARVDVILIRTSSHSKTTLETMTLVEKLDAVQAQYNDLETSIQHEVSVKSRCVDRISKLSQTMSFQVVEHEKQLKEKQSENQALHSQLQEMQTKYDAAEQTLENLQSQVEAMKVSSRFSPSPVKPATSDRLLLQQFSARLETAMMEAKCVVDHKDSIIRELQAQLEQLEVANGNLEKRLVEDEKVWKKEESDKWETANSEFDTHKSQWQADVAKWQATSATLEDQLRTTQQQLTHQQAAAAEEAEKSRGALETLENEYVGKMTALQQQMSEERLETTALYDATMAKKEAEIATLEESLRAREQQVAHLLETTRTLEEFKHASDSRIHELEKERDQLETTGSNEKKKLEKKVRVLMQERQQQDDENERYEHEMAQAVQRLNGEMDALRAERATMENDLHGLLSQAQAQERERESQTEQQHKEQIVMLQDCIAQLKNDKHELDERTYTLEQRTARKLVEREMQLTAESDAKLRDLMERHAAELLQRDLELNKLRSRIARQQPPQPQPVALSASSSSFSSYSSISSSSPLGEQRDLDELDGVVDGSGSGRRRSKKEKTTTEITKLAKLKDKIAVLRQQLSSLTHALAIANEQETIAKETIEKQRDQYERMMYAQEELLLQANTLKQENWMLSLALHVTENRLHTIEETTTSPINLGVEILENT